MLFLTYLLYRFALKKKYVLAFRVTGLAKHVDVV